MNDSSERQRPLVSLRAFVLAFIRQLAHAPKVLRAVTAFFEQIAGLLRQLVHVVGWLVLLVSAISLLIHPHVTLDHLAVPGAAVLAVAQNLIKPRRH